MIHLFLSYKKTSVDTMKTNNGDVIIDDLISGEVVEKRNDIWYVKAEFLESELQGLTLTTESVIRCDAGPIKGQLFRIVYHKVKRKKHTVEIYATHVFYDSQKEVWVKDQRTISSTWDGAISTANDIITNSGTSFPYKVYGSPWHDNYKQVEPENGMLCAIHNDFDPSFVCDIKSWSTAPGAVLQIYPQATPYNSNQVFLIERYTEEEFLKRFPEMTGKLSIYKNDNYDYKCLGIFGFRSVISGGWINRYNSSNDNYTTVRQYTQSDSIGSSADESWCLYSNTSHKSYKICSATRFNTNWYGGEGTLHASTAIFLYGHGIHNFASVLKWTFEDVEAVNTAYWENMNLIQCLFGSEDNSLINRWVEAERHHYVAMFDNYDCYFGRMDKYKDELKPKEWLITDRDVTDYSKTINMEDVVTGLYPKGYNGRTDGTLIKADNHDDYEIHRYDFAEYTDVKYSEDDSSINTHYLNNFADLNAMYLHLHYLAKRDLKYISKWQYPKTETEAKLVDFLIGQYGSDIKLNDTIYYQHKSDREKFYIDEVHYDLINGKVSDLDLVLESEVNQ